MEPPFSKHKRRLPRPNSVHACLACCIVLPLALAVLASSTLPNTASVCAAIPAMLACIMGLLVALEFAGFPPVRWLLCSGAATYYLALIVLLGYDATPWSHDFSIGFLREYASEILPALTRIYGLQATAAVFAAAGAIWLLLFAVFMRVSARLRATLPGACSSWKSATAALVGVTLLSNTAVANGDIVLHSLRGSEDAAISDTVSGFAQDYSGIDITPHDSLFVVQLESVSSMALLHPFTLRDKHYDGSYLPGLHAIAKDGVFFPNFVASQSPTNRAHETLHCGVVGNASQALSTATERVPKFCLPKLLTDAGYRTVAFRSDNLDFQGMGSLLKSVGFSEVHESDIMKPEDKKYEWGYDDCTFYKRAFDYLKATRVDGQKLYVYFEVSSHHWPFMPKEEYQTTYPFPDPANFMERYINSASAQDACLSTFYSEFNAFADDDTHLAIHSDHGFPLGATKSEGAGYINGAQSEVFLIPYLFVPSRSRKSEFAAGSVRKDAYYAESDLLPTYIELLTGHALRNSLVFAFRGQPLNKLLYEECHVMTNAVPSMAAIRGTGQYAMYRPADGQVMVDDLSVDFDMRHPVPLEQRISAETFMQTYGCPRYTRAPFVPLALKGSH